jgi:hypothetical protein
VLKTESVPQIVTVTSLLVIMKLPTKLSVHLVTKDVTLVLPMKLVSLVPLEDKTMPQLVTVHPTNTKMVLSSVKNVTSDVLNVTLTNTLVPLVPMSEFLPQVVIVQMVFGLMMSMKTLSVKLVLMSVLPVLLKMSVLPVPQNTTHHQSAQCSHQVLNLLKLKISQSVPLSLLLVKTNVYLVSVTVILVTLVLKTDLTHQSVYVTITSILQVKNVNLVNTNVLLVPLLLTVLTLVLETESIYQPVTVLLVPMKPTKLIVQLVTTDVLPVTDKPTLVKPVLE